MRLNKFFLIAPTTLLLIVLQSFRLNFPVPKAASPVVAQTLDARKAEARPIVLAKRHFFTGILAQFLIDKMRLRW